MTKSEFEDLEKQLLSIEVRTSQSELDKLIAEDFIEFGSSGRIWNKTELLDELPSQEPLGSAEIFDLEVSDLGAEHALVRYLLDLEGAKSLRSSIWRKRSDKWEIIFHQGTRSG